MTFSLLSTRPLTGPLSRRHRGRRTLAIQRPWASPAFRTDSTGLAAGALLRLHVHGMGGGGSCERPDSGDLARTCELVVLTSSQVKPVLQEPRREQRGVRLGETCRPGGWPSCVGGSGSAGTLEEGGVGTGRPGSGGVAGHCHGTYVHVCTCPGQFLRPLGWKHVYPGIDHLSLTISHYWTLHPSHLG